MTGRSRVVLALALVLLALGSVAIGIEFDRQARAASPLATDRILETFAGFPLDDAWIHQVYAQSFADRFRLEYNPGELETGQSSLLWGVLLAVVVPFGGFGRQEDVLPTRALGVLLWILLMLASVRATWRLGLPARMATALVVGVFVAFDPRLAFSAGSGMEVMLTALTLVLAVDAWMRRGWLACGVWCGLALLARPECGSVVALLVVGALIERREGRWDLTPRAAAWIAIPAAVLASIWVGFCLTATGRPLPNTFYVKGAVLGLGEALVATARLVAHAVSSLPACELYTGYLFLALGLLALWFRAGGRAAFAWIGSPVIFLAGVAATRPLPELDAFYWQRYWLPAAPFLIVLVAAGFSPLCIAMRDLLRRPDDSVSSNEGDLEIDDVPPPPPPPPQMKLPEPVLAVLLLVLGLLPFATLSQRLRDSADEFAANVRDTDAMNVAAADWVRQHFITRVAAQDAGAIRYFDGRVLDLIGLNDHHLIDAAQREGGLLEYLDRSDIRTMLLLDPDPGSVEFFEYAKARGFTETARFGVDAYSLFGPPRPKAIVVLSRR